MYVYLSLYTYIMIYHDISPSSAPRAPAPPPPAKQATDDSEETGRHVVVVLHRFTCSGKKNKKTTN